MYARSFAVTVLVTLVLASTSSAAQVQPPADQLRAVVKNAVQQARTHAPAGATAIGFADSLNISSAQGDQIARDLGYERSSLATKRVCSGGRGPAYCHLAGIRAFVQVTGVSVSEDAAKVFLTIADEPSKKASHAHGVHYSDFEVVLKKQGGSWTVVQIQTATT